MLKKSIFFIFFNLFSNEWGIKLKKKIEEIKENIYEIIEKKLSKITTLMIFFLKHFQSKTNILIILNCICLFSELLKIKFGVNYSKYLNLSAKNLVVDLMKNDTYKDIQKICTFISGETFQKTLLNENSWYN